MSGLNGSGRSPAGLDLDRVRADGIADGDALPTFHVHSVTVPGAAAAWFVLIEKLRVVKMSSISGFNPVKSVYT